LLFYREFNFADSWIFPNLSVFCVSYWSVRGEAIMTKLEEIFSYWIRKLPVSLQKIKLPYQRCACIKIDAITTICKAQTQLVHISWASHVSIFLNHYLTLMVFVQGGFFNSAVPEFLLVLYRLHDLADWHTFPYWRALWVATMHSYLISNCTNASNCREANGAPVLRY
jgi:hypothetical protein